MSGHLPNHLTKTKSLPLLLRSDRSLKWLVLDEVDCLLNGGGFGGQVEQMVQQLHWCCRGQVGGVSAARAFQSVLVLATVTRKLEWTAGRVPSEDGNGGVWAWARG
jgi:hypothetical protein